MRCRNCGHDNSEKNRFCGMCGGALESPRTAEPDTVVKKTPARVEAAERQEPRPVEQLAEPVSVVRTETPREIKFVEPSAAESKPRSHKWWADEDETTTTGGSSLLGLSAAPPPEPRGGQPSEVAENATASEDRVEADARPSKSRSDKWWVDESDTTVGGPSFLGLSNSEESNGAYSYLLDEEEHRSHKGGWVLLAILAVLGGVVYAKWQPIRDYVLTTAIAHSQSKQPVVQQPASDAGATASNSAAASSAPTTTLASSDTPSQPTITTEQPAITTEKPAKPPTTTDNKPEANAPEGQKADAGGEAARGSTAAAKTGADASKSAVETTAADSKSGTPAAKSPTNSKAAQVAKAAPEPADEDTAEDADQETPTVAKQNRQPVTRPRVPQPNPGSELVSSGERYLYGRGVARNCDQAVSYFNAAASKQNPQALSHLGALYATGECVPMDRVTAYAYFRRAYAKEPSNHYFEQNLTMLWREMTPDERQRATGVKTSSF